MMNSVLSGFIFHKTKSKPRHNSLIMVTIKEIYDMATDSNHTIVNSDPEGDNMSDHDFSDNKQKAAVNPFLLVPATPMFVEGVLSVGGPGSPKKSRRKRKGDSHSDGKEKKDKKVSIEAPKSSKKDKSKAKLFPEFWAKAPGFPQITAPPQNQDVSNKDANLLEALTQIFDKHNIVGEPAKEINELINSAIGQICALRSSVHKMEDRLNKMEEKINSNSNEKTYATVAKDKTKTVKSTTEVKSNTNKDFPELPKLVKDKNKQTPGATSATAPKAKTPVKPAKTVARKPEILKPKPSVPTLVVKPTVEGSSFQTLKKQLEEKINLKALGIKVINCAPSAGNVVIVRLQNSDMLDTLQRTISEHTELKTMCNARTPKGRNPQIIIYDIAKADMSREEKESQFLEQLRNSNDLPVGEMKAIFRRKGRGSLQHWIISVTPEIFDSLKEEKRLHLGFGSYKFTEFLDPLRCFKCQKFGHVSKNCSEQATLCSRCPGVHVFSKCTTANTVCRNCRDYNKRTNSRISVDHPETSIYLTHGSRPTRKGVRPWQGLPGKESRPASGGTPCTQPQDSIYSLSRKRYKTPIGCKYKNTIVNTNQ
ncbi:hypothetical protein AVEN_166842-1 [Araneus ventricosus]|uniref:CCHC-type domain-containing protein n=1 Tax=Araneus ventricosus TaxID=182803 RepID=A0A4Y2HAL0_ARAVE|nr:hypothetical protein AVEN_166842-1 [Araneus ventricosus]